jgi:hypothetical protein
VLTDRATIALKELKNGLFLSKTTMSLQRRRISSFQQLILVVLTLLVLASFLVRHGGGVRAQEEHDDNEPKNLENGEEEGEYEMVSVPFGVPQRINLREAEGYTREIIEETIWYVSETIPRHRLYRKHLSKCTADDQDCSYWAATSQCIVNPQYMHASCSAVCKTCHLLGKDLDTIDDTSSQVVGSDSAWIAQVYSELSESVEISIQPRSLGKPRRRRTLRQQKAIVENRYKYGSRRRRAREPRTSSSNE